MKKTNDITELVFILDRSGSMGGLESDTIGGYNSMLKRQKEAEGEVLVSTVLFNDRSEVIYDRVKRMIERQKEKYGWEFLFLGANIDAIGTAGRFGISADRAANYHSDHEGTELNYKVLADAVCEMRRSSAPIDAGWKREIDEDYRRRGKKGR